MLEFDLTPNRPDCLSIVGIAREIAAIQKTRLEYPETILPTAEDHIARYTSVTIENPDHCPRYAARLLSGITVGSSPFWLQERLISVGLRPINNIVDITNYVLLEFGHPLHAFDLNKLNGKQIIVRIGMVVGKSQFKVLKIKKNTLLLVAGSNDCTRADQHHDFD